MKAVLLKVLVCEECNSQRFDSGLFVEEEEFDTDDGMMYSCGNCGIALEGE